MGFFKKKNVLNNPNNVFTEQLEQLFRKMKNLKKQIKFFPMRVLYKPVTIYTCI